jgi:hypothetical protein
VVQETGIPRGTQVSGISGLTQATEYRCWAIATNAVGSSCSTPIDVYTAAELTTQRVIAGDQTVSIYVPEYTGAPNGTSVGYQVQCLSASATQCQPQATGPEALQPSTPATSANVTAVTGLLNDVTYQCFSVASITYNSETIYACSGPFEVKPFTQPNITALTFGDTQVLVTTGEYVAPFGATDVRYQAQCRSSGSSLCDPSDTGSAALQPGTPGLNFGTTAVTGLTNNVTVDCFVVVSYTLSSGTKYTCSDASLAVATDVVPTLPTENVIASSGKLTITPTTFDPPTGGTNVEYQVQCFQSITTSCNPAGS